MSSLCLKGWGGVEFEKCLEVGEGCSAFGFVGEHQCFESDVSSYMKSMEGSEKWGDLEQNNRAC